MTTVAGVEVRGSTAGDFAKILTPEALAFVAAGNIAVAQAYSGDVVQLQADNPDLQFVVPEETIMAVIHDYTREAGVRSLEREIGTICRKIAKDWLKSGQEEGKKYSLRPKDLIKYLGTPKYRKQSREHANEIVFLRRVVPGGANKSYGIDVARLAGLPRHVIGRAREIMSKLEGGAPLLSERDKGNVSFSAWAASLPASRR